MTEAIPVFMKPTPRVRRVPLDRPWAWLAQGWRDMTSAPQVSLAYGALIFALSVAITAALVLSDAIYLVLPLAAGFFLIAPLLAVGLYEASRRLESGQPVTLADAVGAWRRNATQIASMGLVLMLFHLAWVRIATLLFALSFDDARPGWNVALDLVLSAQGLPFLITGTVIGAILAAVVFGLGALSIPMLLDRDTNVFTAIATSWVAVQANWKPMALWAVLIVFFVGVGLATFYVGLIVTVPLIGHATWHAYRDLVEP